MSDWPLFSKPQSDQVFDNNYIADASELGLILVTGDDAENFLQNQLSNDISEVTEHRFQLSSYSTPKGRMLAIFKIIRIDNGYILILPATLVPTILQRLQMFVIQAKVSLADASAHFTRFVIQTDQTKIINNPFLPQDQFGVLQNDSLIALKIDSTNGQNRYLLLSLSIDEMKSIWTNCSKYLATTSFDSWRLSEVKAGMPVIYPDTSEEFVAQMTNLNLIGGVNFKKGCYPGQEIIARMQYLGKLKRRMFLAKLDTSVCPLPGDDLVSQNATIADGSGKVIDAMIDHQGECFCLFVAQIKKAENNQLQLLTQSGVAIELLELPYSLSSS